MTEPVIDPVIEKSGPEDDWSWFAAHPRRRYRLRERLAGELPDQEKSTHLIVIRVSRELHTLCRVTVVGPSPRDTDRELARLHAMTVDYEPAYIVNSRVYSDYSVGLAFRPGAGKRESVNPLLGRS
jgi:hypothetical protein